jgi:PrcB C-terminal
MVRVAPILLLLLISACSASDDSGPDETPPETREAREVRVERLAAGAPGEGPQRPRVVVTPSAEALSEELGAEIRDSGSGTYLVAHAGERPTGGYSVNVAGARIEGDRVVIRVSLKGPPSDAIVTQVLSYPYVISALRGVTPEGKSFAFVDENGEKLDWPVRRVGG